MRQQLSREQQALLVELLDSQAWQIAMRVINEDMMQAQLKASQHTRDGQFHEATQQQARADTLAFLPDVLRKVANGPEGR